MEQRSTHPYLEVSTLGSLSDNDHHGDNNFTYYTMKKSSLTSPVVSLFYRPMLGLNKQRKTEPRCCICRTLFGYRGSRMR